MTIIIMSNLPSSQFTNCPCCNSPVYNDLLLSHIFYEHSMTFYLWANFYYPGIFMLSSDELDMDIMVSADSATANYEALSELCDRLGNVRVPVKDFEASTRPVEENKELKCPICLEMTTQNRAIKNCRHEYCESCLRHWFELNHVCPVCKISANPPLESLEPSEE